jgi:hypothetical protein
MSGIPLYTVVLKTHKIGSIWQQFYGHLMQLAFKFWSLHIALGLECWHQCFKAFNCEIKFIF